MKVGDRVRVKKDGQLCWAKSGKVYVPDFYIGYVTYVNHGNGNLMVHLEELDGSVQTSIEHWIEVEYEDGTHTSVNLLSRLDGRIGGHYAHPSLEEHPPDCPWHKDWHACNCGLFDKESEE